MIGEAPDDPGRARDRPAYDPFRRKMAGWSCIAFGLLFGGAAAVILGSEIVYKVGCVFGWLDHMHDADGVAECVPVWGLGRSAMYSIGLGIVSGVFFLGETSVAGRRMLDALAARLAKWFGR